jgi:cyanophycinase-like exopeptidase
VDRLRPIVLLADSQLLFWKEAGGQPFLLRVRKVLERDPADLKAAYLGASNGDVPAFYDLFVAAMTSVGIKACCHVRAHPDEAARRFLGESDLVLLAGGDPWRGWNAFEQAGIVDVVRARYAAGAVLIGVSAGAIQLGTHGARGVDGGFIEGQDIVPYETLRMVPFLVGAHEEDTEWAALAALVRTKAGAYRGIGVPSGGGVLVHPDLRLEPVRHPMVELAYDGQQVVRRRIS